MGFVESGVMVRIPFITSGNNVARLTTAGAFIATSPTTMKLYVDSNRRPKGCITVHQTLEYLYFDSLCTLYASQNIKVTGPLALDHHVFNIVSKQWFKKSSKPSPFVMSTDAVEHDDYSQFFYCSMKFIVYEDACC